jgi:hypothetical protein
MTARTHMTHRDPHKVEIPVNLVSNVEARWLWMGLSSWLADSNERPHCLSFFHVAFIHAGCILNISQY